MPRNEQVPPGVVVWFQKTVIWKDLQKKKFHESGFNLAVIPGGLTSICQLLDVLINKPFKDNLHKEWHTWMASGGAGETAAVNLSALD
ncbi:unnamed protein product [Rhizophagus irregularis]|nr:unnamed protein product [Rhizophagus irregularis]